MKDPKNMWNSTGFAAVDLLTVKTGRNRNGGPGMEVDSPIQNGVKSP